MGADLASGGRRRGVVGASRGLAPRIGVAQKPVGDSFGARGKAFPPNSDALGCGRWTRVASEVKNKNEGEGGKEGYEGEKASKRVRGEREGVEEGVAILEKSVERGNDNRREKGRDEVFVLGSARDDGKREVSEVVRHEK